MEHTVSFSTHNDDDQIVVLASPPLLTIDTPRKTVLARPGATVRLPVTIRRNARLKDAAVKVELAPPKQMRGLSARHYEVPPSAKDCELEIQFADHDLGPWNAPLIVRATTVAPAHSVIAEIPLTVTGP
jgi:hypothetical protein